MLEVEYSRVLCLSSSRDVSPVSEVDICNRPGAKYTTGFLSQCQEEGWPLPGLYLQESGSNSRAW